MLKVETIQKKHKEGIQALLENLNRVDQLGYSLTDEWLDYVIETTSDSIFIATASGRLVGIGTCMINETDKSHAVVNVAVDPHFRKQGIGSQLYKQILSYCEDQKVSHMEAYVKKRLGAGVSFAQKRAFEPALYAWQMDLDIANAKIDLADEDHKGLLFRKATLKDKGLYAKMMNEVFGDLLDNKVLGQLLKDPSIQVYLLEKGGRVIGSITAQTRTSLSFGYIYDVAIDQAFRGQGRGTYLLARCIEDLAGRGIETASLTVTGQNKEALGLYHKLGFKEVDTDIIFKRVKKFEN